MSCKRIGLTGGIGSGKTTVALEFARLGVPCFISDVEAKRLYRDPHFVAQLEEALKLKLTLVDGTIDKARLRQCVFESSHQRQQITDLIHPKVLANFEEFCQRNSGAPYVIFESAILYEHHIDQLMDRVVCVYLSLDERMQRLMLRDNTTPQQIRQQMDAQLPDELKRNRADYVIENYEGNPRVAQVLAIHRQLCSLQ